MTNEKYYCDCCKNKVTERSHNYQKYDLKCKEILCLVCQLAWRIQVGGERTGDPESLNRMMIADLVSKYNINVDNIYNCINSENFKNLLKNKHE